MAALRKLDAVIVLAVCLGSCLAIPSQEFFSSALTPPKDGGKTWVLLVAGSSGWMNYRHQADVCHAYQVFRQHQIAEEQIVVMMFDDIATSFFNTIKGQVFNEPNGSDVYAGVVKDYTGKLVSPKHFLSILSGDKHAMRGIGTGRVIESGPADKVVVFFTDHGAPGMLFFPTTMKVMAHKLRARDLTNAILRMHSEGKYGEMLLYIEACESGSMFNGLLPTDINVLAMTASSPFESSMACYYNNTLGVYIGDCFSNHLWEHEDASPPPGETLRQQFNTLKRKTNSSHLCLYGDPSLASQPVSDFIPPSSSLSVPAMTASADHAMVSSRFVAEDTLRRRLEAAEAVRAPQDPYVQQVRAELAEERAKIREAEALFAAIAQQISAGDEETLSKLWGDVNPATCHTKGTKDFSCLEHVMEYVEDKCGAFTDHSLMYAGLLQRACEGHAVEKIEQAVQQTCTATNAITAAKSKCHSCTSVDDCKSAGCKWCKSAAVPSKCYTEAEAAKLPPAIFSCV